MATSLVDAPGPDRVNIFQKVRAQINEIFDSLMEKVNVRREVLLSQLYQWEEEFNRTRASCIQSLEEIKRERAEIEECLSKLKMNQARTSMGKGIADLSSVISEKEKKLYYQVRFVCDKNGLELKISKFGSFSKETDKVLVRNYTQLSKPVKVFGTFGKGKGEFTNPRGVVIDNENQRIFIADCYNSHIQVWSMEGEYLSEFGGNLRSPWEILLRDNFIYISDINGHTLSKWCLNTFTFVKESNVHKGPEPGQLNRPAGLDIDKEDLFVVEHGNKRISVFDLNLRFKRIMAEDSITNSYCLRVRSSIVYIVEETGVIKLFSTLGQLLNTIPKLPQFHKTVFHFNFDLQSNFLITIPFQNSLFILSPEGNIIHSVDFNELKSIINTPFSISAFQDGRLLICFQDGSNVFAIF